MVQWGSVSFEWDRSHLTTPLSGVTPLFRGRKRQQQKNTHTQTHTRQIPLSSPCCDLNLFCLEYEYPPGSWCTSREEADRTLEHYIHMVWIICKSMNLRWALHIFTILSRSIRRWRLKAALYTVHDTTNNSNPPKKQNKTQHTQAVSLRANLLMKICGSGCLVIIGLEQTQKPSFCYCKSHLTFTQAIAGGNENIQAGGRDFAFRVYGQANVFALTCCQTSRAKMNKQKHYKLEH